MSFRSLFESVSINEGTQAAIIVKTSDDTYSMSYAQYDGYLKGIGEELKHNFRTDKDVRKLVSKSGEIRSIVNGKIEFYTDRTLLKKRMSEGKVVDEANNFAKYKYYWDGIKWSYTDKSIGSIDDINRPL